ncbi:MAG TPA: translocation/assembly module TamB domain-containing protein [Gemmatimonadales bacterium]|nr:translocation/assembly module TamB domain-containing protein [Gemmatimonadales bacterium]
MLRRTVILAAGLVGGLILAAVALVAVVLGTAPGHAALRRIALGALSRAVDGRVTIGSVSGSLWHAAELRDVTLSTPDGRPVIRVGRVRVTYALASLARGRYVLSGVQLDRPTVVLEEGADGHLNIEHLFRLLEPGLPGGKRALVELNGVHLTDGTVIVREAPVPGDAPPERRFTAIQLDAPVVRVSHPDSAGVVADLRHFSVAVSDPAVRLKDAAGRVVVAGDSVRFNLTHVELRGTSGRAEGTVRWGRGAAPGRAKLDVAAELPRVSLADFRWAAPGLPEEGRGRTAMRLRLLAGGGSQWIFRDADLSSGRSRVRGSVALVVGRNGGAKFDTLAVDVQPLDLALLTPFLGRPPVAGVVRGRIRAKGTPASLDVTTDLALADEGVAGRPVSRAAGSGFVTVGGSFGLAFHRFSLTSADVALATIQKLAPSVTLHGRLLLGGTLDGPWRDAAFAGTLRHGDGPGAGSSTRGTARLTLADTVRIAADLVADSLSLDDLRRSWPAIRLRGSVAGTVKVNGPVTALAIDAALAGERGGVTVRGVVAARDSAVEVGLGGSLDSLDLAGRFGGAPATRLYGEWRADLAIPTADTAASPTGTLSVTLAASRVAGVELERAGGRVALTRERLQIDTLYAQQPALDFAASGALGREGRAAGGVSFSLRADTLELLESAVAWARGLAGVDSAERRVVVRGALRAGGRVTGSLERWEVQGDLVADSARLGTLAVWRGRVGGALRRTARGLAFALRAGADTLRVGGLRYSGVALAATGPQDSLAVHAAGAFALGSSVQLDALLGADSSGARARLDAASLALRGRVWTLAGHPLLAVTREAVAIDTLDFRGQGGGRVVLAGRFPLAAPGDLRLVADSVPLADLYALAEADTSGVDGLLNVTGHLAGPAADPTITATAAVVGGRFGDFRAPRVDAAAEYAVKRLVFHAGLRSEREQVLTASGTLPLDLSLVQVAERQLPDSLRIRVRADSVDLGVLDALTALVRDVHGQLTADVEVGGTWDKPSLEGSARISGGAATIPALGARYTGVDAQMALGGDRLTVQAAHLKGGAGTLGVTGDVRFEELTHPVLDLTVTASGFSAFTQRDFAGLTASGEVHLAGPVVGATLSGRVTVDAGFLAFADLVEKRIVNLDDPEFRAVVDSSLARASELGPSVKNVFLDSLRIRGLTVSMGPDVWLRSHEANIQLAGDFTVAREVEGEPGRYRLDGELRAVRGTYRLTVGPTSKEFRVTKGTVRFFGTPDLNPVLDIVAEHPVRAVQGNDIVVRAVIGGTLLVPKLSLESDQRPPLSETEIVSYLLFGRPSFDLASGGAGGSSSEQAIFQGALTGLAGVLSGELEQTLVTDLGLPVDYIAIRPGGGTVGDIFGSARVEAGTQIGERTFLTLNAGLCQVTRGLTSQALGASVEYRLTRRWSMEASVEPTVEECRSIGFLIRPPAPYQIGFDLFWQSEGP